MITKKKPSYETIFCMCALFTILPLQFLPFCSDPGNGEQGYCTVCNDEKQPERNCRGVEGGNYTELNKSVWFGSGRRSGEGTETTTPMLLCARWRRSGISCSNLSCQSCGGALGPPVMNERWGRSLLFKSSRFGPGVRPGTRGFGAAQSPWSRSQDAELVEGSGVGWQSVSVCQLCHVHFVLFVCPKCTCLK